MERARPSDHLTRDLVGADEVDGADAAELAKRPPGREDLIGLIGVHDAVSLEVTGHHCFDHCREDAKRDVAVDALLGEVEDRPQPEKVLQHPKAPLDALDRTDAILVGGNPLSAPPGSCPGSGSTQLCAKKWNAPYFWSIDILGVMRYWSDHVAAPVAPVLPRRNSSWPGTIRRIRAAAVLGLVFTVAIAASNLTAAVAAPSRVVASAQQRGVSDFNNAFAVSTDANYVWIVDSEASDVSVLNVRTAKPIWLLGTHEFHLDEPCSIADDGTDVWVANCLGNSVTEVNALNGRLVRVIDGRSYGFDVPESVSSDGSDVWVLSLFGSKVTEINAKSGALVRVISGPSYQFGQSISSSAIFSDGDHVWVTDETGDSVTELNTSGDLVQVLRSSRFGFDGPLSISSNRDDVWVLNHLGNSVTELDAATGAFLRLVDAPQDGLTFSTSDGVLAVDDQHVWIGNPILNEVDELDASNGSFIGTIQSASKFGDISSISSNGRFVWVANASADSATEIRAVDDEYVQTVQTVR